MVLKLKGEISRTCIMRYADDIEICIHGSQRSQDKMEVVFH